MRRNCWFYLSLFVLYSSCHSTGNRLISLSVNQKVYVAIAKSLSILATGKPSHQPIVVVHRGEKSTGPAYSLVSAEAIAAGRLPRIPVTSNRIFNASPAW